MKDFRGGTRMHVLSAVERVDKARVAADMRQKPQFDLRIVRADEDVAFARDERLADLASLGRAHRNVLQVGLRA